MGARHASADVDVDAADRAVTPTIAETGAVLLQAFRAVFDPGGEYPYAMQWPTPQVPFFGGDQIALYAVGPVADASRTKEHRPAYMVQWRFQLWRCAPGVTLPELEDGEVMWPDAEDLTEWSASVITDQERSFNALAQVAVGVLGSCSGPYPVSAAQPPLTIGPCVLWELGIDQPWQGRRV